MGKIASDISDVIPGLYQVFIKSRKLATTTPFSIKPDLMSLFIIITLSVIKPTMIYPDISIFLNQKLFFNQS